MHSNVRSAGRLVVPVVPRERRYVGVQLVHPKVKRVERPHHGEERARIVDQVLRWVHGLQRS
jgi:hypothetical protein